MLYRKGGGGLSEDSSKAADFFEKGCTLGSRNSCYMASVVYLTGEETLGFKAIFLSYLAVLQAETTLLQTNPRLPCWRRRAADLDTRGAV